MKNKENLSHILEVIRSRRSIFPALYTDEEIPTSLIHLILETANWAPSHKLTEPWRFKVFRGDKKNDLGVFLDQKIIQNFDPNSTKKIKPNKFLRKCEKADTIILICMQRDPQERVPEWEEIAATAMAVQNMWLTCSSLSIGSYWSSPSLLKDIGELIELKPGERCLGMFYMGYHKMPEIHGQRSPIEGKTTWFI